MTTIARITELHRDIEMMPMFVDDGASVDTRFSWMVGSSEIKRQFLIETHWVWCETYINYIFFIK